MSLWSKSSSHPVVIGHRGAMGYAPENTLISFEEAFRRGADWIEMDVQLSSDGQIVVIHDPSVDRTTDGEGLVRELSWKKIKGLDAGYWYGPEFIGQHVPSLDEVLDRFRNRRTTTGRTSGFVIELKTARGSGGLLADQVVALVKSKEMTSRVVVISFDAAALMEVRSADRHIQTGFLYSDGGDESRLEQAKHLSVNAIFPKKTCVTSRAVTSAQKAGLAVGTWTANTAIEMKRLLACGLDAVTTNYPDRLRSLIG